ncbi:MAG: TlpA disulfide reductase family protein [Desulfoprunum sp.]|nr:TlpA disulfide reductase family protein [Desulfoprunum sp.]
MKNLHSLCCIVCICLFVTAAGPLTGISRASTKMPAFSLANAVDGKNVDSKDFQGKALLVTFFATWCPPCMQEVATLVELQQEFAKEGFSVIGLSVDQGGAAEVAQLVERQAINYPVLMADAETAENFGGVFGIPISFLVNKSGNVVKSYTGLVSHTVLVKDVRSVIE